MAVEAGDDDLYLSDILALMARALIRRPFSAFVLSVLTIALPSWWHASIVEPSEGPFSAEFATYAVLTFLIASPSILFAAWMALQLAGAELPLVEALKQVVPLLIATVLVACIVLLGFVALLIPGIIFSLALSVTIPATAVERLGAVRAIERSLDLTRNRRWAILCVTIAVIIPPLLAVGLFELAMNGWQLFPKEQSPIVLNVSRPITDTFQVVLGAALGAALYVELARLSRLKADVAPAG
jgi:hypothetical protein